MEPYQDELDELLAAWRQYVAAKETGAIEINFLQGEPRDIHLHRHRRFERTKRCPKCDQVMARKTGRWWCGCGNVLKT